MATTVALVALITPVRASQADASYDWKCPKITHLIKATFPREVWRTMDYIAARESKCVRQAVGWNYRSGMSHLDCPDGRYFVHMKCRAVKSHDVGYFQINSSWNSVTQRLCGRSTRTKVLMRADCQFKVARYLYDNGGLAHWQGQSGDGK